MRAVHAGFTDVACCPTARDWLCSLPHDQVPRAGCRWRLRRGAGSLGIHEAQSACTALARCLAELDQDSVADQDAARDPELAELLRREQQQVRDALAEPDVSFIATHRLVAAEAHFVRDHDGELRPAGEAAPSASR